jgi:hypothetical protein
MISTCRATIRMTSPVASSRQLTPAPPVAEPHTVARPPERGVESERLRLARLARDAALGVLGVVAPDSGSGGFVTVSGDRRIDGVTCLAAAGGGYDVLVNLVCRLVPLPALGDRVRHAVESAGATAGIPVARVSVRVAQVVGLEEG